MLGNIVRNSLTKRSQPLVRARLSQCNHNIRCNRVVFPRSTAGQTPMSSSARRTVTESTRTNATLAAPRFVERKSVYQVIEGALRKQRKIPLPRWLSPQHRSFSLVEIFGHSSFMLVAVSYAVDDFLMLRILAVAGSTAMLVFAYVHPHGRVLWLPFQWNLLFIGINSYRIGKVYWDRYCASLLSEEYLDLRSKHFYLMEPQDFARLIHLGTVKEYRNGDLVVGQGENNRFVRLVLDGDLKVLRDGKLTYMLETANFISECGLHAGLMLPGQMESCCAIVADSNSRIIYWDRTELIELMQRDSGVRRSLKATMTWDVVSKLKKQRLLLADGKVDNPTAWTKRRNEQTRHRYAAILHNLLMHPYYLKTRRNELNKYRMIHHIDDENHNHALEQVGWTPEEFERGWKDGQESDAIEEERGFQWYLSEYYFRVFGR